MAGPSSDKELIERLCEWAGKTPSELARGAGLTPSTLTRVVNGTVKHRLSTPTLLKLRTRYPGFPGFTKSPDLPPAPAEISYVPVRVLPTFAGMGGGGTGDAEEESALVPRYLVEDMFRGRANDFLLVRVRGDSMEPDFQHDDELLCDTRDRSPAQPGPFALWHDQEYVVKNVEKTHSGQVRIFSSNPKYTSADLALEDTRIIGRPVWFARRL